MSKTDLKGTRVREEGAERGATRLAGQTVVVIGGSSGIGLETARLAGEEGAKVIITARHRDRLESVGRDLGVEVAPFDATDFDQLGEFFDGLTGPLDHILVTGPGPYYAPLEELDLDRARHHVESHLFLPIEVARNAATKVRPGGTLLFIGGPPFSPVALAHCPGWPFDPGRTPAPGRFR